MTCVENLAPPVATNGGATVQSDADICAAVDTTMDNSGLCRDVTHSDSDTFKYHYQYLYKLRPGL